jgi:capsular exopolysaccharide synthesis family protein
VKSISAPFQIALKLTFKWWWLILICVALGGGGGYYIRSHQPDVYYAKAGIWFGNNIGAVNADGTTQTSYSNIGSMITIYQALGREATILQPVIDKLNLGISVDKLNSVVNFDKAIGLPVLTVTVGDTDPVKASELANAIAQQIINNSPTEAISQDTAFKREQLQRLQAQITQLETDYNNHLASVGSLTSAVAIAQNQKETQQIATTLQDQRTLYAQLSLAVGDTSNALRLWYTATATNAIKVSNSLISVVLAGGAGLLIAIATIVLIAFFDDRLQWHENLEEVMGVRILGPLGIVPRNKLPLYVASMPDSIENEVLHQMRAKMVLAAGGTAPKVILLTSYDSGDGKTLTCANLGYAAAQSGMRTLLIDGDIRKGDLHEIFNLPNVMGLSDILAGRDDVDILLSRAILDTGYDHLSLLTSGRSTADAASLVSKPRFAQVMNSLRQRFDFIVIDSVPTIGGPDAAFMADLSDGVVIVVRAQRTTNKGLKRTLQSLSQAQNARILGLVFNRIALQVTSTYNQPYYRRTLSISPDKLNRELLDAGKRSGLLKLNRNVVVDKDGHRLYSISAAAVQLGVSEETLHKWISIGYLKAQRRGRRRWILEADLNALLDQIPRYQYPYNSTMTPPAIAPSVTPVPDDVKKSSGKVISGKLPGIPRGQRDALLASARERSTSDQPTDDK